MCHSLFLPPPLLLSLFSSYFIHSFPFCFLSLPPIFSLPAGVFVACSLAFHPVAPSPPSSPLFPPRSIPTPSSSPPPGTHISRLFVSAGKIQENIETYTEGRKFGLLPPSSPSPPLPHYFCSFPSFLPFLLILPFFSSLVFFSLHSTPYPPTVSFFPPYFLYSFSFLPFHTTSLFLSPSCLFSSCSFLFVSFLLSFPFRHTCPLVFLPAFFCSHPFLNIFFLLSSPSFSLSSNIPSIPFSSPALLSNSNYLTLAYFSHFFLPIQIFLPLPHASFFLSLLFLILQFISYFPSLSFSVSFFLFSPLLSFLFSSFYLYFMFYILAFLPLTFHLLPYLSFSFIVICN